MIELRIHSLILAAFVSKYLHLSFDIFEIARVIENTSERGTVTKSSPHGTVEDPFNPAELALGAQSSFYARVPDTDVKLMTSVMVEAE